MNTKLRERNISLENVTPTIMKFIGNGEFCVIILCKLCDRISDLFTFLAKLSDKTIEKLASSNMKLTIGKMFAFTYLYFIECRHTEQRSFQFTIEIGKT